MFECVAFIPLQVFSADPVEVAEVGGEIHPVEEEPGGSVDQVGGERVQENPERFCDTPGGENDLSHAGLLPQVIRQRVGLFFLKPVPEPADKLVGGIPKVPPPGHVGSTIPDKPEKELEFVPLLRGSARLIQQFLGSETPGTVRRRIKPESDAEERRDKPLVLCGVADMEVDAFFRRNWRSRSGFADLRDLRGLRRPEPEGFLWMFASLAHRARVIQIQFSRDGHRLTGRCQTDQSAFPVRLSW